MAVVALLLCAALLLAGFLFLMVAPLSVLMFKTIGVLPATWGEVEKHCCKSAIAGLVCMGLGSLLYFVLHAAFTPWTGH